MSHCEEAELRGGGAARRRSCEEAEPGGGGAERRRSREETELQGGGAATNQLEFRCELVAILLSEIFVHADVSLTADLVT